VPLIAIDGPSGSGKSTLARALAQRLGLPRLDTGAMYRAVALAVLRAGADPFDGERAGAIARRASVEVGERVLLDGEDVTEEIRSPEVDAVVSVVAAHPSVRRILQARQRAWAEERGGGVVEGRDIGTAVLPDATVKVFLVADLDERARRRAGEARGTPAAEARSTIERRDALDGGREDSPLRQAPDAIVLDSTRRSVDELVEEVLARL
jgi:cytidylate kinase